VQAVPDINLILTKLNEIPCVENQEKSIRLIFNRSRAVFRTLFFVLIFGISVLALLHLIKDWGAKSSFFSAIFLFMGCVAAGCATFLSASASLYPQYIEITTHGITEKNKNILLTYSWTELGNPRIVVKNRGNHYIVFDNTKIQLLPEEFCCRESELLGIINTARSGQLIDLSQWRKEHPLERWIQIFMGLAVFLALLLWKFGTTFWHHS
jgi:hypothetical protein